MNSNNGDIVYNLNHDNSDTIVNAMAFEDFCYDALLEPTQNELLNEFNTQNYMLSAPHQELNNNAMGVDYVIPEVYSQENYATHNYEFPDTSNNNNNIVSSDIYYTINEKGPEECMNMKKKSDAELQFVINKPIASHNKILETGQYINDLSNYEPIYLNCNLSPNSINNGDENDEDNIIMRNDSSAYFEILDDTQQYRIGHNIVLPPPMQNNQLNRGLMKNANDAINFNIKVNQKDIYLTGKAQDKTVEAITVENFKTQSLIDLEVEQTALIAAKSKEEKDIKEVIISDTVYGIKKGRKQNLRDSIKQNMEIEIFEDEYKPDVISDYSTNKRNLNRLRGKNNVKTVRIVSSGKEITKMIEDKNNNTVGMEPNEFKKDKCFNMGTLKRKTLLKKKTFNYNEETDEDDIYSSDEKFECRTCSMFFKTSRSLVIHKKSCDSDYKADKKNNRKNSERKSTPIADITNAHIKSRTIANETPKKAMMPKKNINEINSSITITNRNAEKNNKNEEVIAVSCVLPVRRIPTSTITSDSLLDDIRETQLKASSQNLKLPTFNTLCRNNNKIENGKKFVVQRSMLSASPTIKNLGSSTYSCEFCNKILTVTKNNLKKKCSYCKTVFYQ